MVDPGKTLCFALLAGSVFGTSTGCKQHRDESPVSAYNKFAEALQKGDLKAAYGLLSLETQRAVEEQAKAVSAASGGMVKIDPITLVFGGAGKPLPLTEIKLANQDGGTGWVGAASGNFVRDVKMVREGSAWKLDLTEWLNRPSG